MRPRRNSAHRRLALFGVAAALCAVNVSCAVLGRRYVQHPITPEQVTQLRPGLTKEQVTGIMGAPREIIFSNKEHDPLREHAYIFEYQIEAGSAIFFGIVNFGRIDAQVDRVVVFFDEQENVSHIGSSLHSHEAALGFPFGK